MHQDPSIPQYTQPSPPRSKFISLRKVAWASHDEPGAGCGSNLQPWGWKTFLLWFLKMDEVQFPSPTLIGIWLWSTSTNLWPTLTRLWTIWATTGHIRKWFSHSIRRVELWWSGSQLAAQWLAEFEGQPKGFQSPHGTPGPKKASGNGETEIFLDVPGEFLGMLKREKKWRGKWEWPKFVHFCD